MRPSPDIEERLAAAIEPWLAHMRWRKDFEAWRDRRIWQERYQADNLRDIKRALGGNLAGKKVLDLGAGMGGLSVAMMRELGPGLQVQAMDYNPDYCEIARLRAEWYGLQLPIVVASGEELPYPFEQFDLVVCLDVLEHVADIEAVMNEIYRVLKPGGATLTSVPNRHAFRDPHYHLAFINWLPRPLAERIIRMAGRSKEQGPLRDRQGLSELNTYTWEEFARLAKGLGFGVRDQVYQRITSGEIRQLRSWRRALLKALRKTELLGLFYRVYRYGWQGTYQILLVKPK
jgi:ubiquinone/menaquinone biosynthesis C-methylase UbiE